MKNAKIIILAFMLLSPFFMSAQSIVGKWDMGGKDENGNTMQNIVTFNEDGTLTVDFGNDGTVNVRSTYTVNGNQISIKDTSADSPCQDQIGVYEVTIEGDVATAKVIDDPCDVRKGDGGIGTMTRVK